MSMQQVATGLIEGLVYQLNKSEKENLKLALSVFLRRLITIFRLSINHLGLKLQFQKQSEPFVQHTFKVQELTTELVLLDLWEDTLVSLQCQQLMVVETLTSAQFHNFPLVLIILVRSSWSLRSLLVYLSRTNQEKTFSDSCSRRSRGWGSGCSQTQRRSLKRYIGKYQTSCNSLTY